MANSGMDSWGFYFSIQGSQQRLDQILNEGVQSSVIRHLRFEEDRYQANYPRTDT